MLQGIYEKCRPLTIGIEMDNSMMTTMTVLCYYYLLQTAGMHVCSHLLCNYLANARHNGNVAITNPHRTHTPHSMAQSYNHASHPHPDEISKSALVLGLVLPPSWLPQVHRQQVMELGLSRMALAQCTATGSWHWHCASRDSSSKPFDLT